MTPPPKSRAWLDRLIGRASPENSSFERIPTWAANMKRMLAIYEEYHRRGIAQLKTPNL